MAALEIVALDEATPQLRAPGAVDTYTAPRALAVTGGLTLDGNAILRGDAANTLAMRNSTSAQAFQIYNTYTDASNYERGFVGWDTNEFVIKSVSAGTGSNRNMVIDSATANVTIKSLGTTRVLFSNTGIRFLQPPTPNTSRGADLGASALPWNDLHMGGKFINANDGELTIATGAVTATGSFHTVDTEADAASDDLDTISGGSDGQFLIIQAANDARTVVAKDGTGNLQLAGDCTLDNTQDTLTLVYSGTLSAWIEISRSDNGA